MAKKKLPQVIHVAWRELENDDPYLSANTTRADCLEDDGPTEVGTYRLESVRTLKKVISEERA